MLDPFLKIFKDARVGFILIQRDETTALPYFYFEKLPKITPNTLIVILEPMLATGGSMNTTINTLKNKGIAENQIISVHAICATQGLERIHEEFPEVKIIYAVKDEKLNDKKFILPGLGDYGDRYYGTN